MALQVWLPLNGNLNNKGLANINMSSSILPSYTNNGKIGKAIVFQNSIDTSIYDLNKCPDLKYTDNFSYCMWVKGVSTGSAAASYLFTVGRADSGSYGYGIYIVNSTKIGFKFGTFNITKNILSDQWNFIAFIKKGNILTFYINGEISSSTFSGTLPTYSDSEYNSLGIGCFHYNRDIYPCNATINDFRIYDHALSIKEVKEISKGLILHYKLDNLLNNKIYDCSGYLNDGTISGTLSLNNNSPRYNYSLVFNGSSFIKSKDLNLNETSNFTISSWINITASQSYQPIFWLGNGTTSQGISIHGSTSNRIEGGNGTNRFDTTLNTINLNSWTHIVITYDGTTIKRYINGSLNGTISFPYLFGNTFIRIYIGYFWGSKFKGNISDFRLYLTTLSDTDIQELYNNSANIDNYGNIYSFEFNEEENNKVQILKTGIIKINNFIEVNDCIYLPAGTWIDTGLNYNNGDICKTETIIKYESGGTGRDLMGYSASGGGYWGVTSSGYWEPHGEFTYTNSDITKKNTIIYIFSSNSEHGTYKIGALGTSYSVRNKFIYRVRLYKNNKLERDLYPIQIGNKIGLFDILHNEYYLANNINGELKNDNIIEASIFKNKIESNQLLEK